MTATTMTIPTMRFTSFAIPFTSRYITLPVENIDTDQIIPARFLKTTDRSGLGVHAFHDWRYDASGSPNPDFVINHPDADGAEILVAGRNFGCGSSREHAPWALVGAGFRVVISSEFADIFRGNALKNGLLPVQIPADVLHDLLGKTRDAESRNLTVNLVSGTLTLPDGSTTDFAIEPFARHCLINNVDQLGFLLGHEQHIATYESTRRTPVLTR